VEREFTKIMVDISRFGEQVAQDEKTTFKTLTVRKKDKHLDKKHQ